MCGCTHTFAWIQSWEATKDIKFRQKNKEAMETALRYLTAVTSSMPFDGIKDLNMGTVGRTV